MPYDVADLRARLDGAWKFRILADHTEDEHWYKRDDTERRAASVTTKQGIINKPYLKPWNIKVAVEYVRTHADRFRAGDDMVLEEAKKAPYRDLAQAGEWGTTAHGAIERYCLDWIRDGRPPARSASDYLLPDAAGEEICACRSFDKFRSENEFIVVASEQQVWYEEGKDCFAGTVDAILLWLSVRKGREGDAGVQDLEGNPHQEHDYVPQSGNVWWCPPCGREVDVSLILGDWKTSNSIAGHDDYAQQTTAYAKAVEVATGLKFDDIYVIRFDKKRPTYEIRKVDDRKAAWRQFLLISRAFDEIKSREEGTLLVPLKEREVISLYDPTQMADHEPAGHSSTH